MDSIAYAAGHAAVRGCSLSHKRSTSYHHCMQGVRSAAQSYTAQTDTVLNTSARKSTYPLMFRAGAHHRDAEQSQSPTALNRTSSNVLIARVHGIHYYKSNYRQ